MSVEKMELRQVDDEDLCPIYNFTVEYEDGTRKVFIFNGNHHEMFKELKKHSKFTFGFTDKHSELKISHADKDNTLGKLFLIFQTNILPYNLQVYRWEQFLEFSL